MSELKDRRLEAAQRALGIVNQPLDKHVKNLCEYFGYGAVMDSVARQWAMKDPMGAFFIGGALGVKSLPEFVLEHMKEDKDANKPEA